MKNGVQYQPDDLHSFPGALWTYRRTIRLADCPHLHTPQKLRERKNIEAKYGKNSAFVKSMIYGEFQASEEGNNVYETGHIEMLKRAMRRDSKPIPGDVRASGDVAGGGGGGDDQLLGVREGTDVLWINTNQSESEIEMADYWVATLRALEIQPFQFWIDGGGTGAPVANYMEKRLGYTGINRCNGNTGPIADMEFRDHYTEVHWWLKELLIYDVLRLPFNKNLIEQMRDRKYVVMDDTEKIKMQPKEKYRADHQQRSPNELDMLVYLFWDFPMDQVRKGRSTAIQQRTADEKKKDPHSDWSEYERRAGTGSAKLFSNLQAMPTLDDLRKNCGYKTS